MFVGGGGSVGGGPDVGVGGAVGLGSGAAITDVVNASTKMRPIGNNE